MRPHSASHACLVRRFSLATDVQFADERRQTKEGERRTRSPERMHLTESLVLAVLHRTRRNVLDGRLIRTDEHNVRYEHRRCEYRE